MRKPDPYRVTRTFSFRLRLTRRQRKAFAVLLERERLLYNAAHEERIQSYRWACRLASVLGMPRFRRADVEAIEPATLDPHRAALRQALLDWESPTFDRQKDALALVAQRRVLGEVVVDTPAVITRWTLSMLDKAWQGFFRRVVEGKTPGFPRFKAMGRWRTFGCHELSNGAFDRPPEAEPEGPGLRRFGHDVTFAVNKRRLGSLKIPGVDGAVDVRMHRPLPDGAELRACSFTLRDGEWTANLQVAEWVTRATCDVDLSTLTADEILGVDMGVIHQATDSLGNSYPNVRAAAKRKAAVRRAQRKLARARKNSNNRDRKRRELARLKRLEANERKLVANRNSSAVVRVTRANGLRAMAREDLDLRNMLRSAKGTEAEPGTNVARKAAFNRALADAGLGGFARGLDAKAARAGLPMFAVDPRWTTMACRDCRLLVPKPPSVRIHRCPRCGLAMQRDHMAAGNVALKASVLARDPEGRAVKRVAAEWRRARAAARKANGTKAKSGPQRAGSSPAAGTANENTKRRGDAPGAVVRPGVPKHRPGAGPRAA